jgi:hypothetical protein
MMVSIILSSLISVGALGYGLVRGLEASGLRKLMESRGISVEVRIRDPKANKE